MYKSKKTLFVSLLLVLSLLLGLMPTAAFAVPQSTVKISLFSDNFESSSTANWTVLNGTWGIYDDAGNKVYRQSSLAGTTRSVAGDSSWANYSFSADVNVETLASYTTNSVHLMARFIDINNYYDLTYTSSEQTLALRKKVAGTWTVLQSISNPLTNDTEYNLKINVNGSTISGFVNGVQKLSVSDTSFTNGKVGFSTFNQSAKFDNVVVNPAILEYEAENAVISGATVGGTISNYTGTGYVDYNNNSGDYIQWTVNAPVAGAYILEFRYANGSGTDRPLELKVNNTLVTSAFSFPATSKWSEWVRISTSVNLNAGNNTVKLTTNGSNGPNIDKLSVYQITEYEAENAVLSGAIVGSSNVGYTGTGYADYLNNSGDYIQWTVNAPMAGTYTLEFRYSNASGADRPLELKVNNTLATSALSFPATSTWTTWVSISTNVNLNAGNNTIKLTTNGSNGANIDKLSVYQITDVARATTVTIDYSEDWGAATQLASGFLHGIGPVYPDQKLINSLAVRAVRGAPHHAILPSLFDPATYNRVKATGAKIMIGTYYGYTDVYGAKPGGDYVAWENFVRSYLNEATQNNFDVYSWITWNEPDLQWSGNIAGFKETHRRAYNVIKAWNPSAKVQAPEWAVYNSESMKDFLTYCKANNCLPDVLSWHELGGTPDDIEGHTLDIKNWMLANGITPMPFAVTEYQGVGEVTVNQGHDPGLSVANIARLERSQQNGLIYGLKGNCQWQGNDPDFKAGLDELADKDTLSLPTGRWYLYYWYAKATGRKVKTIQNNDQVEAFATSDSGAKRSIVLLGNPSDTISYDTPLKLNNIPSYLQSEGKVNVRVESVGNTNGLEQHGTTIILEGNYTVTNNSVSITLPRMGTDTAYIVKVTPGTTYEYQAESLSQTNSGDSYSVFSEAQASEGSAATYAANAVGDWVRYTINVPVAGTYNIKALLKKEGNRGVSQLYVNDVAKGSIVDLYGPFLYFDADYGNVTFSTAGDQTLEFRVTGKNGLSSGYSLTFDKFTLTKQ